MRSSFAVGVALAIVFTASHESSASIVFSGTGNNPEVGVNAAGSATFSIAGNNLTVVLQNLTGPRTTDQGNAMTGVAFDIHAASLKLTLTSTAITAGSAIWTSEASSNISNPLAGSWTNKLGSSPLAAYGVATTGFNGRFKGGSITLGNSSPDYGIVAAGTFDGTKVALGGSQFPFIQDSLTFTFADVTGISESQIENVKLLFGTDGTGVVTGNRVPNKHMPEPASFVIWLLLACAIAMGRRGRRS
ncbi:MAG: XDD4 family exosortase-dependent surface protein [Pirellulaceae bacterium]